MLLERGFRETNAYALAFYSNDLDHPAGSFAVDEWGHVANVYDHTKGQQKLYFNGKEVPQTRRSARPLKATGDFHIGIDIAGSEYFQGQLADFRIWNRARSAPQISAHYSQRLTGTENGLIAYLPLDGEVTNRVKDGPQPQRTKTRFARASDLPLPGLGSGLVTAEYTTIGRDPIQSEKSRAILRRFYAVTRPAGDIDLLPGKRIEELELKWISNAQFEPTLLGYIEGPPPAPSENLTVNYDYDNATSVAVTQSEETAYTWFRSKDEAGGLDINLFLGAAWGVSGGLGIQTKITEGQAGARFIANSQWRSSRTSNIRLSSTNAFTDKLQLRGAFENRPKFPHLGNRYVPKNVGYALVISGLADVFITRMKRSKRMISYDVRPVEDVPLDINTITFLINPNYTINGSLDGLVGTSAADERFCKNVPEMRAQYGALYPSGYYNLPQAYAIKSQIDQLDKDREAYFSNFDAKVLSFDSSSLDTLEAPSASGPGIDLGGSQEGQQSEKKDAKDSDAAKKLQASSKAQGKRDRQAAEQRKKEIQKRIADQDQMAEASAGLEQWQRRMEHLQVQAAKRNIVNTYVWDADGGMRSEEQDFASTVEHSIGGTFTFNGSLGPDVNVQFGGFKFELSALATLELTQTITKTRTTARTLDLSVLLDGLERKGITDARDYPVLPGEKVDRYRFMTYYLEGDTSHFNDFFDQVVDPEWLMSNDEEARALRQMQNGRPNKCWRVMHRVTYVERPALMGFGRDLRTDSSQAAAEQVFNYFTALERSSDRLRIDVGDVKTAVDALSRKMDNTGKAKGASPSGDQKVPNVAPGSSVFSVDDLIAKHVADQIKILIDVNTATLNELVSVAGVSQAIAGAIIDYRTKNGAFKTIDDLTKVQGIGAAMMAKLKTVLKIGPS